MYAGASKLFAFGDFKIEIGQSPLISAYASWISYAVIGVEFTIALLLCPARTRLAGLYLSLGLMVSFTIYIYLILNHSEFVPCSCGGILGELGWTEHLIFNIVCVLMALCGIAILERRRKTTWIKTGLWAGIISLAGALIVVLLFLTSEYIIKKDNNFTRRFLQHPIIKDKSFDLGVNSYYFAGIDSAHIYLGNVTVPLMLTTLDIELRDSSWTRISLDNSDYAFRSLKMQVKSPNYYLYDGTVPVIYRGSLGKPDAKTISYRDAYFSQIVVMDSNRFILRTQNAKNKEFSIAELNLAKQPRLTLKPDVLERQIDGLFDSDGKLYGNSDRTQIFYTYFYRNQFMVMDSNIYVKHRLNTIDTTTRAKISVAQLSDGRSKMGKPPLKVNGNSTANRWLVFNQSKLMGRNESVDAWKNASIVDMYRTDRQEYVGSLYVHNKGKIGMSDMLATDKYLYVIIGRELVRYQFRPSATKYFRKGDAENLRE